MKHLFTLCVGLLLLASPAGHAQRRPAIAPPPPATTAKVRPPVEDQFPQGSDIACGTVPATEQEMENLPWYGDTLYLPHLYDSLMNAAGNPQARGIESVQRRIPVKFWVYTDGVSTPTTGAGSTPTAQEYQRMMDNLNNTFRNNGIPVRFYMLCPTIVTDPTAVAMETDSEMAWEGLNHKAIGAVNIHIAQVSSAVFNPVGDAVFLPHGVYSDTNGAFPPVFRRITSVSHEVGHYFGLQHTFWGSKLTCWQEPVGRGYVARGVCPQTFAFTACAVTGDLLTDTDADHEDLRSNCPYVGTMTDYKGAQYRPDPTNLMTYLNNTCRFRFTRQQQAVIMRNIYLVRAVQAWSADWGSTSAAREFDEFEPDNERATARPLQLDEAQEHTFHSDGCGDRDDWVRFTLYTGVSSYVVEVTDLSTNPVNAIEVYNSTGTLVPTTPLPSTGNKRRWLIACGQVVGGTEYALHVVANGGAVGRYRLNVTASTPTISGLESLCLQQAQQYAATNLPAGATVTWRVEPATAPIALSTTTGLTTMATLTGAPGSYSIVAAVANANGCSFDLYRPIYIFGDPQPSLYPSTLNPVCVGTMVELRAYLPPNLVNWPNFRVDNGWPMVQTYDRATGLAVIAADVPIDPSGPGITNLHIDYVGSCSGQTVNVDWPFQATEFQPDGTRCPLAPGFKGLALYPNPADDYLLVNPAAVQEASRRNTAPAPTQVEVYNSRGTLVRSVRVEQTSARIATDNLPEGLYHVVLRTGEQITRHNLEIKH